MYRNLKMTKIIFVGNPVSEWFEVCKLGRVFPNLEYLVVAECPIQSLMTPPLSPDPANRGLLSYPNQWNEVRGEIYINKSCNSN